MNSILVKQINTTSPEYQQVWELRDEVLRKPLGLSLKNNNLSWDKDAMIFIAVQNEQVIGCVLLTQIDSHTGKLRAMAVAENWQGKGIGRLLVNALEKAAPEVGYNKIVLHARKVAVDFYKKLAYTTTSDEFTEVGIPHFVMEKELK